MGLMLDTPVFKLLRDGYALTFSELRRLYAPTDSQQHDVVEKLRAPRVSTPFARRHRAAGNYSAP